MKPTQTLSSKTLVVAPNWVGDSVMAIPMLDALSATGRSLTVLARPHLKPLLETVSAVDRIVVRARSDRQTIHVLRELGFEEAVILPNSFRSAWLAFRAGIPVRWGYRGDLRSGLLEPPVKRPAGLRHQLNDYDALLERLGAPIPTGPPRLDLSASLLDSGRAALRDAGVRSEEDLKTVGVFPGAEFGPSKRWPSSCFAELLRELGERAPLQTVLIAGPGEEPLAAEIQRNSTTVVPVVGPRLNLAELAAVLARLDVLITNDSGPMHVAAATGTACVALFGPTNPTRTAPAGDRHRVLYNHRWCSPCFKKRCPLLHQRCMRDLSVTRVIDTLVEILG
ncbi:MAG: lipopolysaccharide heptosyltransferase II [bacterium]|nr:lipopolysaccharide heptosyltransferase II [bacterium]